VIIIFDKNVTFPFTSGVLLDLDYKRIVILLIARICPFSTLIYIRVSPGLSLSLSIIPVYYSPAEFVKSI
jgi:hypothetical protein